jgi:hypothetical protein
MRRRYGQDSGTIITCRAPSRSKVQIKANSCSWKELLISHLGTQRTAVCFMGIYYVFFLLHVKNFRDNAGIQKIAMLSILIKLTIETANSFNIFLYVSKALFLSLYSYRACHITLVCIIIHVSKQQRYKFKYNIHLII